MIVDHLINKYQHLNILLCIMIFSAFILHSNSIHLDHILIYLDIYIYIYCINLYQAMLEYPQVINILRYIVYIYVHYKDYHKVYFPIKLYIYIFHNMNNLNRNVSEPSILSSISNFSMYLHLLIGFNISVVVFLLTLLLI